MRRTGTKKQQHRVINCAANDSVMSLFTYFCMGRKGKRKGLGRDGILVGVGVNDLEF